MDKGILYLGFDLGDGESSISYSKDIQAITPIPVSITGKGSFLTAIGKLDGKDVIGQFTNTAGVTDLHVCFKRHFLEGGEDTFHYIQAFVRGVLTELRKDSEIRRLLNLTAHCLL